MSLSTFLKTKTKNIMIYSIKQAPDDFASSLGLDNYDRSRMPGCFDMYQAAKDATGRYITGLTPEEVQTLSTPAMDLSDTSPYWEKFAVVIKSDENKILDSDKVLDYISYKLLVANKYVAPSKEDLDSYDFANASYYFYNEPEEDARRITGMKKKDSAKSVLLKMADDKEKMLLYGQYLEGIKYTERLKEATLYRMLSEYIDESEDNIKSFLDATSKSPHELQAKIIVDKALKKKLIRKSQVGKNKYVYQYGQVTLGSTIEDVYNNLINNTEFAPELEALKKEVDK